jgi:chromosome segregation ATPase
MPASLKCKTCGEPVTDPISRKVNLKGSVYCTACDKGGGGPEATYGADPAELETANKTIADLEAQVADLTSKVKTPSPSATKLRSELKEVKAELEKANKTITELTTSPTQGDYADASATEEPDDEPSGPEIFQ